MEQLKYCMTAKLIMLDAKDTKMAYVKVILIQLRNLSSVSKNFWRSLMPIKSQRGHWVFMLPI